VELGIFIFLSSGLFLGWSLGANDAANIFGTAVGSRMVKFATAALIGSVFVILGAVISGGGAAHTLGKLGAVNAMGGAFTVAFAAAITVYWMTKARLPVSTSQAIVGAIIGWNMFAGARTEFSTMSKILLTWVLCPVLAAITAVMLYMGTRKVLRMASPHLLTLDSVTRLALLAAGAFGAYSLGANNIANVMGVFIPSSPFHDISVGSLVLTGTQQLFLLGAVAIAVGIYTYSKRVMLTVGSGLMPLTPVAAWVVVMSHSIVLFLFSSEGLEHFLASNGLPTIPLVPVSSSQAVVGAVIGIGLLKGGTQLDWKVAGRIATGWVTTPAIAALVSVFALFVLQNVFQQQVQHPIKYEVSEAVIEQLQGQGAPVQGLDKLTGTIFSSARQLSKALDKDSALDKARKEQLLDYAELHFVRVNMDKLNDRASASFNAAQLKALKMQDGRVYEHPWQLEQDLASRSAEWQLREDLVINKQHNKEIQTQLRILMRLFAVEE